MYYHVYEWNHVFLAPARALNDAIRLYYKNPLNPWSHTDFGKQIAAAGDVFERLTRRYGKPEFGVDTVTVDGETVDVDERIVWERPFCRLVHFQKLSRGKPIPNQPAVVIVAPMSGHYATLLRGTVEALLPEHDVYITDWIDARMVPLAEGRFDLDTYVDYMVDIIDHFRGALHIVAVCQPAVPVFAATAVLEARQEKGLPRSITLMGGPIDTRESPTEVNTYAAGRDLDWFRRNVIMTVPFPHPGVWRRVYPGFLQLTGFMTMNLDRHMNAHYDYFNHLVSGDGDGAEKHREFYDEYLSVMDLTAEFYLQTVDTVFLRHLLPKGEMMHRDVRVDPSAIRHTPIFTVEGEKDDISGLGQTRAAHKLTPNLADEKHQHYEQAGVGHYGVFNGSRFRKEIAPRIAAFVARWDRPDGVQTPNDTGVALAEPKALPAAPVEAAPPAEAASASEGTAISQTNGATPPAAPLEATPVGSTTSTATEPVAAVANGSAPPEAAAKPAANGQLDPARAANDAGPAPKPAKTSRKKSKRTNSASTPASTGAGDAPN